MLTNNLLSIFYCGTNGAGKSTLRSFNQDSVQIVIDSDHIAMQINPENPRLADLDAGRKAIDLFQFALKNHIAFSMESTLSGKSILQRMKKAKEQGFFARLNYVGVNDPDINIARVKARVKSGGHFIDEKTIRQRYEISRRNLINAIEICDEIFIYDNSDEKPEVIFHLTKDKKLAILTDELPRWCNYLLSELILSGFNGINSI